jgi:alkanesulfonate monooxygenase SsuD/methylene tetrahydromethanopterin reductase-like flavin-dependent oxidoreductase (luciferase family)
VAQHTERVRIGHGVRLAPPAFNHPARSAEMAAVLDIMSRGRLEFGVGRSITEQELGGFGLDPAQSRPMLDEVLPEIVRMWTTDPYPGFEGTYFSMPERQVLPKPVQQPHPPLWMACTQPASFDLAADYGIGVLAFGVGAPGNVVDSLTRYKERVKHPSRQVGHVVNDAVAPATLMYCAPDEKEALEMGGVAALWYGAQTAKLFAPWMGRDVEGYEYYTNLVHDPEFMKQFQVPFEERLRDEYSLVGTPDKVAQGVQAYVDIGADQLICLVQAGRIPHERIMESLRLFGKEVLPRFR